MQVTLKLPDEIMKGRGDSPEVSRRVLEAVILQSYLLEEISQGRLAELLGLSRGEAEAFLDHNNARLPFTQEMIEEDRRNLAEVLGPK